MVVEYTTQFAQAFGQPKDKPDNFEKQGIYVIQCNDCDLKDYSQTRRSIRSRFKEHLRHLKYMDYGF